jgi:hypothetical protein
MEITHFPTLPLGANFVIDGMAYTKTSELVYRDSVGIECYIDPLFDAKIGKMKEAAAKAAVLPQTSTIPAATIQKAMEATFGEKEPVLSDTDVERIARRVAELIKGQ